MAEIPFNVAIAVLRKCKSIWFDTQVGATIHWFDPNNGMVVASGQRFNEESPIEMRVRFSLEWIDRLKPLHIDMHSYLNEEASSIFLQCSNRKIQASKHMDTPLGSAVNFRLTDFFVSTFVEAQKEAHRVAEEEKIQDSIPKPFRAKYYLTGQKKKK